MASLMKNFFRGLILGVANIIPGVSAGTMALIMGMYEKLINSINQLTKIKGIKKDTVLFLGVIAFGALCGILSLANIMDGLLSSPFTRQLTYFIIIGLVLGSIPIITKLHDDMKPTLPRILVLVISTALAILLGSLAGSKESVVGGNVTPILFGIFGYNGFNLGYDIWLLVCGFLASGAMVLPGISGSALLVSLGEYGNMLNAVSERLIIQIIFFGIGILLGIAIFTKLISYFIKNHTALTYYFVIGMMLSSIYQSIVQMEFKIDMSPSAIIFSTILLALGIISSYCLSKFDIKGKTNATRSE